MRVEKSFYARFALTAAAAAATLFVFGAGPVRAQTAVPATEPTSVTGLALPAAQPQGPVRRLSINESVAMALEQNIVLQVDRINPQVQDLAISVAKSNWTPALFSNVRTQSQSNPTTDIFGGAASLTNDTLSTQAC